MERISGRQNATVKRFRALARSRASTGTDDVLLEGAHLVGEALDSGLQIDLLAFSETAAREPLAQLLHRAERSGSPIVIVADAVFDAVSPVRRPAGVVAIARLAPSGIDEVLTKAPQLVLALDGVQDPGNVGAIIRAAEACGATGVIVSGGCADPFGWKALRGSMGSTLRLPVAAGLSLGEAIEAARRAGLRVIATAPRGGTRLAHCDLRGPAVIVLGGEGPGIPDAVLAAADERVTIPMQPPVESLNVAVAAALVLYEASRQRTDVTV